MTPLFASMARAAALASDQALQFLPFTLAAMILTELLLRYGVFARLEPLGAPLTRLSRLPPVSTLTFIAGMGSVAAANAMLAAYRNDRIIDDRELVLSSLLNSIPVYLKELLTYHFPVIFPLLGPRVGGIYLAAFWLAGLIKLGVVVVAGRLLLKNRQRSAEAGGDATLRCSATPKRSTDESFVHTLLSCVAAQKRLFFRVAGYSVGMLFAVLFCMELGFFTWTENLIGPMACSLGLPAVVLGPLGVYAVNPLAGVSSLSALLASQQISAQQTVVALMIGGLAMAPLIYLRSMLPNYIALFGARLGGTIVLLSLLCALSARVLILWLAVAAG